jgi:hypothetical protein
MTIPTRHPIRFECPACGAHHERGFVDGHSVFRCLRCGYLGRGFSEDRELDDAVFAEHEEANRVNRSLGLPEVPLGVDPLRGPG